MTSKAKLTRPETTPSPDKKEFVIVHRKISELKPAEYNPRSLSEKQFNDLKKSFKNLGTLEPAVINMYPGRENIIISGHQRIKVATDLKMTEYPCLEVSFPPKKEKEANIRMNKNTGTWDFEILANEFEPSELMDWGFEDIELGIKEKQVENSGIGELKELFMLEIDCKNEDEQEKAFEDLTKRGYECRILRL